MTYKKIFLFWMPLAATWLMMSIEGPFLAAIIARLVEPKFNLAAYGVAFSFALLSEAPIMMIMSASTALVRDGDSFRKLRRFTYLLNAAVTLFLAAGLWPAVFSKITETFIGLPHEVARLTHLATIILLPWPAAIGYRRFYQGILISQNRTRYVAYGTVVRLTTMLMTAMTLRQIEGVPGAAVGMGALSAGVVAEAVASHLMARPSIRILLESTPGESLHYRGIIRFYYPLALTTMIALGAHPMVTFFMGQARKPLESLAVLPVINALVFIFRSLGLSYQEVVIALTGEGNAGYRELRKFAGFLGLAVVGGLALIAFTPLSALWFETISGLPTELADFARQPTQILALIPGLSVLLSLQRATMVNARHTAPVTVATVLEVSGIILMLVAGIKFFDLVGALAAAFSYVVGRLLANSFLGFANRRVLRRMGGAPSA